MEVTSQYLVSLLDECEMVPVRAEVIKVIDEYEEVPDKERKVPRYRSFWCDLPDTIRSGIVQQMSREQIALQEAIHEVIRTEENYLHRLAILHEHFSENLKRMLPPREWKEIFEFVQPVLQVSQRFLEDLLAERRRSRGSYLGALNFCFVFQRHAEGDFVEYIRYCCNQIYQQRSLQQLKSSYPVFAEELKRLETTAQCTDQSRTLESYLMLPVQRITLLPLLIDAIIKNVSGDSEEFEACLLLSSKIKEIVRLCNEKSRDIHRKEEMLIAGNELAFNEVPTIAILTQNRILVKKGMVKKLHKLHTANYHMSARLKFSQKELWIYLFNDLIVVTRKRKAVSENRHKVLTYCQRNMAVIFNESAKIPELVPEEFDTVGFQLCLLQNHHNMVEEMILLCDSGETKESWVELLSSKSKLRATYPKIYQEWDCPQMCVKIPFEPHQPNYLPLRVGEQIDVREKRSDGWWYGCKCGIVKSEGWFPQSNVEKSPSVYERAKILRRNYQRRRRKLLEEKPVKEHRFKNKFVFSYM